VRSAPIDDIVPTGRERPPSVAESPGERRHLTVLFSDLVGSTALSERLDPEELRQLVLVYQDIAVRAIEEHGGYVANFVGDGVLAFFGYPIADELATVRAVRAGLAIARRVSQRADDLPELAVRVGVHCGMTVVADMGVGSQRLQRDAVGKTPNVAARVQSVAAPGQVALTDVVKQACEGYFEFASIGSFELKGLDGELQLYRAVADTGADSRLDVATAARRLTPLVGRGTEVDALVAAWRRTQMGDGQVVWLSGEPGIGKSRLVRELVNRVRADGGIEIEFRCSALHRSSILYPSAEQFRRYLLGTTGELSIEGVEALADENNTPRGFAVPVVAELLGIPLVAPYQAVTGSADHVRQHTLDVLARLIDDRARLQPVLVVIEDLQWIDATNAELAERFIGPDQRSDVMTLVTYRSDHRPDIPSAPHHQRMTVDRLKPEDIRQIIKAVAGERGLGEAVDEQVLQRTEGIPLFAEELTQLLVSNETGGVGLAVPSTLRDSLMARVDSLGPEASVLRTLSVLGPEAPEGLLFEVSGLDRTEFNSYVSELLRVGLLIRRGEGTNAAYAFKHALQQEVVYESMLRSMRRQLHATAARAIEARFIERTITEPETAARHFELGGDDARAVDYLLRAGDRAIAISAHAEALIHLRHARELVARLPVGDSRDAREIAVLVKLGVPVTATTGYGSAAAGEVYSRARALCDSLGDSAQVYPALYGLFRTVMLRAEYQQAEELAQRLDSLAKQQPQRVALAVGANRALGSTRLYRGHDHPRAFAYLEAALDAPDANRPGAYIGDLDDVVDPIVTCRSYAAWAQWLMGNPERARHFSDDAMTAARRLAHPFTVGLAICFDSWLCQFEGDAARTMDRAEQGREHADTYGFPFWLGWAEVLLGWARTRRGDAAGVEAMRAGIEAWEAQGSRLGKTYFLGLVGEGELLIGDLTSAERTLDTAIALAATLDERFWLPELLRSRAIVHARVGRPHETVLAALDEARRAATAQGAMALVERIDTSRQGPR
jgi:class 3 adenylate cyclase/tetratricopeptide (TPR) repeat protein